MRQLVEVLISGAGLGAVYAVNAIGLSLVYGVSRVFNFSYGVFFTWGAYFAWILSAGAFGLPYPLVFVASVPVLFVAGMLLERSLVRPLRWRPQWQITTMIVTLGLAVALDSLALRIFGPMVKTLPPILSGHVTLAGFVVAKQTVAMLVLAVLTMILLETFLTSTRSGRAMRAVAQDMVGARIVGIPLNRVFALAFGISTVLAGVGGILLAPVYLISPGSGWDPFFRAFVIVVLGGLESIRGTVLAAFILGVGEALVTWRIGASFTMSFWFITLILVLLVRPQGLLGRWA